MWIEFTHRGMKFTTPNLNTVNYILTETKIACQEVMILFNNDSNLLLNKRLIFVPEPADFYYKKYTNLSNYLSSLNLLMQVFG